MALGEEFVARCGKAWVERRVDPRELPTGPSVDDAVALLTFVVERLDKYLNFGHALTVQPGCGAVGAQVLLNGKPVYTYPFVEPYYLRDMCHLGQVLEGLLRHLRALLADEGVLNAVGKLVE